MINPFVVACPDCLVPAGARCVVGSRVANLDGNAVHADRRDRARLRLAVHGTCRLCGEFMIHADEPDDAWHPALDPNTREPIPPCPPHDETPGMHEWRRTGLEGFIPNAEQPPPPADQPNPPPRTPAFTPQADSNPMQDPPGSGVL